MKTIFTRLHLFPGYPWMRLPVLALFFACCYAVPLSAQVSIGVPNPDPSAMLDVSATNKGMLIPRLTTAQRNAIAAPATGLQIFNLDDKCTDLYDGTNWIKNCGLRQVAIGDSSGTNVWVQKANFGGAARQIAVGFSIGAKGYIGTGMDTPGVFKKDFWEYDPATNVWTQKSDFGGTARAGAVGFSIGTKGYIGTGTDALGFKSDFYEYDPGANTWTAKSNFGGAAREGAVGFSIGTKGYIGTGYNPGYLSDFWEYDPVVNSWTPKANFGGTARSYAVGFGMGSKGYIGTGSGTMGYKNDFWEYNPTTNVWVQKADVGGGIRALSTGFSIGNKGYIGSGSNNLGQSKDFWEYDLISNTWTQKADAGNIIRSLTVGFSIGQKGYIGTGNYDGGVVNDFWQYTPTVPAPVYATPLPAGGASSISDGAWTINGPTVYNSNTGNVGIGTGSPAAKLDVTGKTRTTDLQVTGGTPGAGKVLTSDASGNAAWSGGGVIAQTGLMQGNSGTAIPLAASVNEFFGPTITLTLAANQRVVIVMAAGLGRNAAGSSQFNLDIGARIGAGPVLSATGGGYIVNQPVFTASGGRQTYTMIATFKPGIPSTYQIGCSINCTTASYLNSNDWATGYYMIINEN